MDYLPYIITFSHYLGIGPLRYQRLISHFGNPKKAFEASENDMAKVIGSSYLASKFTVFKNNFSARQNLKNFKEKGIRVVTQNCLYYPSQLKQISDPPICLYVKGKVEVLRTPFDCMFAIVGSRKTTSYGKDVTFSISRELSSSGYTIVSGMAYGIDTCAHTSALEHGKTIAVLGCGVDIPYPASNRNLYQKIMESGAVVSEFPPGQTVLKGFFVARNRIISGLSKGVLVVEGAEYSGALITARYALDQGRDLYAIPGPITSHLSYAPNMLIKEGAKPMTAVSDIEGIENQKRSQSLPPLTGLEKQICNILINEERTIDELSVSLKNEVTLIISTLSMLEIKKIVIRNPEGKYALNTSHATM